MTKSFNKIVSRATSPLMQLYDEGMTTNEVKELIRNVLAPEIRNLHILDQHSIPTLAVDAISLVRIKSNSDAEQLYRICLNIHRSLIDSEIENYGEILASWEESIHQGISLYWSGVQLENSKEHLSLEDCAYELLRIIGVMVEGTFQPFLKELLSLRKLMDGTRSSFADINGKSLGQVVSEFRRFGDFKDEFILKSWNIPIHQWRNIAQHLSMKIVGQSIQITFGKGDIAVLSRQDLLDAAHRIFGLFNAVKTARSIQILDESYRLSRFFMPVVERIEKLIFEFSVYLSAQGFRVEDISLGESDVVAQVVDATAEDPFLRGLIASHSTAYLWFLTKREAVVVEYRTNDGLFKLKTTADAKNCAAFVNDEISVEEYSKLVRFEMIDNRERADGEE